MTSTRSAPRSSAGVTRRERWDSRSTPSAAATSTETRSRAAPSHAAVPAGRHLDALAIDPQLLEQRARRHGAAAGVPGADEQHAIQAGSATTCGIKDRRPQRSSQPAWRVGDVLEVAELGDDVQRAAAQQRGARSLTSTSVEEMPPRARPAVEHEIELVAEDRAPPPPAVSAGRCPERLALLETTGPPMRSSRRWHSASLGHAQRHGAARAAHPRRDDRRRAGR